MIQIYLAEGESRMVFEATLPSEVVKEEPLIVGAVDDETQTACGVIAAQVYLDTINILYIEVAEKYRREGVGRRMMSFLHQVAAGLLLEGVGCSYMVEKESDEGKAIDSFFDSVSLSVEKKSPVYRVLVDDLESKIYRLKRPISNGRIIPLEKVSKYDWGSFRESVIRVGLDYNYDNDEDKDKVFLDVGDRADYDEKISYLYINANKRPTGCILFSEEGKRLSLRYLYMLSKGPTSAKVLMRLFVFAFDAVKEAHGLGTIVYVNTQNSISEEILKKMSRDKIEVYGYAIERTSYE